MTLDAILKQGIPGKLSRIGGCLAVGDPTNVAHKEGTPNGIIGVMGLPQVVPSGEWDSQRTIPEMLGVPLELPTMKWESQWTIPEMPGVPLELPTMKWEPQWTSP